MRRLRSAFFCGALMLGPVHAAGAAPADGAPDTPVSWGQATPQPVQRWVAPALDVNRLLAAEAASPVRGPLRVGHGIEADLGPASSGTWHDLPGGDRIWRLRVVSRGALWIVLGFRDLHLPAGAALHVYDPQRRHVFGPLAASGAGDEGESWSAPLAGDELFIELFWPAALRGRSPEFRLTEVSHGYRPLFGVSDPAGVAGAASASASTSALGGPSQSCNVDVQCPLGEPLREQARGVLRLLINTGGSSILCSGSLLNNTNRDCINYVLTAEHCYDLGGSGPSTTFLFDYERPTCNGGGVIGTDVITSATDVAAWDDTDFRLLRIDTAIPPSYNAYYNGWSRLLPGAGEAWSIHHPQGDLRKISHDDGPLQNGQFFPFGHWRVGNWEQGITEPGSSGGPLFDANRRIIGQLNSGLLLSCSNPTANAFDEYGRFDVSWTGGGTAGTRLSNWLDPFGTGELSLTGMDPSYCGVSSPNPVYRSHGIDDTDGNDDGHPDPQDTVGLSLVLLNDSPVAAQSISGTLSTATPLITVVDATANWNDAGPFESVTSDPPHFRFGIDRNYPCGDPIEFQIAGDTSAGAFLTGFTVNTGSVVDFAPAFGDDMESGANGWTSVNLGAGANPWTQSITRALSPTHSWFVPNPTTARDSALLMPPVVGLPADARLQFRHFMASQLGFDGGVLEYSTDGAVWLDAAERIVLGGYTGGISEGFSSALSGRRAWTGDLGGWQAVEVDFSGLEGQTLLLRWRFASDLGTGAEGWYIDDVAFDFGQRACAPAQVRLLPGSACSGDRVGHAGLRPRDCGQPRPRLRSVRDPR